MKTLKNYYVQAVFTLIFVAAFFFGFNLYKLISHFQGPDFAKATLLVAAIVAIFIKYRLSTK
ncbi:hypothetical protein [uncultured Chryseobacterium sp.]|jgi:hypothetical protein|uniref:hypothetical protein n=1 Tax=uncultured Chryseobacterium sp. TaxID=259322 RepID=UPI00261C4307|nr:hypothetical protein [uncultured Chryseobacterium sp.]